MKEVAETLRYLADKLGTTVEMLWPKLVGYEQVVAQTYVTGFKWFWIIFPIFWLGGTALLSYKSDDDFGPGWFVFGGIVGLVGLLITSIALPGSLAAVGFPEAAALKTLLGK